MEVIFRKLKARWNKLNMRRGGHYYGMVIDNSSYPLTNLRFADDVLLIAASKGDVGKMITDLSKEAEKYCCCSHAKPTPAFLSMMSPLALRLKNGLCKLHPAIGNRICHAIHADERGLGEFSQQKRPGSGLYKREWR